MFIKKDIEEVESIVKSLILFNEQSVDHRKHKRNTQILSFQIEVLSHDI
jgi:hypothetical protein